MRTTALTFLSRGQLGLQELGDPPPLGPAEILIETVYTGITNGTERHAFLSEHGYGGGQFPSRHGYQHVGRVAAVGPGVTRYAPGDWVFYGEYVGHRGWNIAAENALLIGLPAGIDPKYAALFGVAGVALRSVRRMGVRAGDNVWVVGQGPIGLFTGPLGRESRSRISSRRACRPPGAAGRTSP